MTEMGIEELIVKAEAGDTDAQLELGIRYFRAQDVQQDRAKAINWFRREPISGRRIADDLIPSDLSEVC